MKWQRVTPEQPVLGSSIILATSEGFLLGEMSGRRPEPDGEEAWFIDSSYYDGDEPPYWWLELPPVPSEGWRELTPGTQYSFFAPSEAVEAEQREWDDFKLKG